MQNRSLAFKYKGHTKNRKIFYSLLVGLAVIYLCSLYLYTQRENTIQEVPSNSGQVQVTTAQQEFNTNGGTITIPDGMHLLPDLKLPPYLSATDKSIKVTPTAADVGKSFTLVFTPADISQKIRTTIEIKIKFSDIDKKGLQAELAKVMGGNAANMGYYIEDYKRGETITFHPTQIFKPGSISKLPVAFIVLKDLDSGKLKLTDTFPIYNKYKHSTYDALGALPAGTQVTIRQYMEELLKQSNNTAQYHLREMIGNPTQDPNIWSSGVLNERVKNELGVSHWSEDPHIVMPRDAAKVWGDLYRGKLVSDKWRSFFLDTLGAATPSLRTGIPAGVPTGVRAVDKVGFLYGGADNVYGDSGIVFGKYTDYFIVIFNDKAPPFPSGSNIIRQMSEITYKYLDKI